MYPGWLSFAGVEIINAARTEAYCHNMSKGWFHGCESCDDLAVGLGDGSYGSPLADNADWVDEDNPDTYDFYGLYPLSLTGFEDSTYTAQAVESLQDGGITTVPRASTRTVVIAGMLVGGSDAACDAGMNWLRAALQGSPCNDSPASCSGDTLCFLLACPEICGDDDDETGMCLDRYMVHMHMVTTIEGPKVTAKHALTDGSAVWEIEFTMVAGKPWVCGMPFPIVTSQPAAGTGTFKPIFNVPTVSCVTPDLPDFRDPTCVALPKPPAIPNVPLNCFTLPTNWDRYSVKIPAQYVPRWSHAVPEVMVTAGSAAPLRMCRIRFYEDPLNWFEPKDLAECDFCSEFLITYIPPTYTMTIDGMTETILIQAGNKLYNAQQSVTSTDNTGFDWPWLTCGSGYIMTIDVPHGAAPPTEVDVLIYPRMA